jgi:hypothetical protein
MDRITHQSPRQRGYGSTCSLRNNSLKHRRKHEKGRNRIKKKSTQALADCPARRGGPYALTTRTVWPALSAHPPWTVRPCAVDHPKKLTEPPETTPNNGPSTGSTRTVRQAPADRPPAAADCPKPCPTKTQSHDGSKAKLRKNTKNTGRTHSSRTVRRFLADCPHLTDRPENSPTSKVISPKSSSDFPNGRSCGDKGLGT